MAQDNVARARAVYEAWNAHDWDRVVEETDPSHEMHLTGLFAGLRPVYRGRDGMREFLESFVAVWKDFRVDLERVEDLGDRVLCLVTLHGSGTGSGVPVSIEYAQVFQLDGERAIRTDGYKSWAQALEAVGLEN